MRISLLVLLLLSTFPLAALAVEPAGSPLPDVDSLVRRLGRPARQGALDELLDDHWPLEPESARRLARALGKSGGRAAAIELAHLLENGDAGVREAALLAAAHVGVRYEPLARRSRWLLRRASSPRERRAAALALGGMGDGRDVPLLIECAESARDSDAARAAAFRALSTLGGADIPADVNRWQAWWTTMAKRDLPDVERALLALGGPEGAYADVHRELLYRNGWLALPTVRKAAAAWLIDPDPRLRREACRLVAALRIADLGPAVASARVFDLQRIYRDDADAALRAIGMASAPEETADR